MRLESALNMKRHWNARAALSLIVVMVAVFQLFTVRGGELSGLEDAHTVYREKYASSPGGVYIDGDTLFAVTEIPWEKGSVNVLLARAMLRGKEMVQDYVAEHFLDPGKKPQPCLLKISFPQTVAFGRESVPGLGLPAFDVNARIRVLEDKAIKERAYRYVISIRLADLKKNIPVGLYGEPSQAEIIAAMKKTWAARQKKSDMAGLCRSFGLVEDILFEEHKRLRSDWPHAPWILLPAHMDAHTLHRNWSDATELARSSQTTPEQIRLALAGAPPLPSVISRLEENARATGKGMEAALWMLWGGSPEAAEIPSSWEANMLAALDCGDAAREFVEIVKSNAAHGLPADLPASAGKATNPVSIAWRCFGHADFSGLNAVPPPEYRTAHALYDKGIELPKIIALASRSAELAPASAAVWSLLGQALFADGRAEAAIPFLVQSLWIDSGNADARTFLAMAYMAGGRRHLAKGMAASVLFACADESAWNTEKAIEVLTDNRE